MYTCNHLRPRKNVYISWILISIIIITGSCNVQQGNYDNYVSVAVTLAQSETATIKGPLKVSLDNPRYFSDPDGNIVFLSGSHTWGNLQDGGFNDPPPSFNYREYLDFLEANNHNFFRLWAWEHARWDAGREEDFWINPMPYLRTGPGLALDGKPKFDLTLFDQRYFDRLRQRVIEAGIRNMYVSVMLFQGWSLDGKNLGQDNPWHGNPYNSENNINGINGDPNGDDSGAEVHSLQIEAITALQEAYVREVVNTLNDLDNVLYEISNESPRGSVSWQYHMINYLKDYQKGLVKQHPVGMTVEWPNGDNSALFASPADWISPNGNIDSPEASSGSKVILLDTDHLCGICGNRNWAWKSFTRGNNPILMDPYDGVNWGLPPGYDPNDPIWISLRRNLGYIILYANRINLKYMTPNGFLCSSNYCLANPVTDGAEYLVYLPNGGSVTVNLSGTSGELRVEWFNPENGITTEGNPVMGGVIRSFTAPFNGDAVLYLHQKQISTRNYLPLVARSQPRTLLYPCKVYAYGKR